MTYKPSKLSQTEQIFRLSSEFIIQNYKSLSAADMIHATLVNTHTDTALTDYTIISASRAKNCQK